MNLQPLLLALFWVLFCALHSIFASLWWKNWMKQAMGSHFRFYRLYYTLFAFASLGAVFAYQFSFPSPRLFQTSWVSQTPGVLGALAGLFIMGICIRKYFMHLSGLKSLYLNDEQAHNQLQVTGIHRYVRHPLYSGTFLFIWSLWLLFPSLSLFIANLVITVYTLMAIKWEEHKLVAEFGESYRRYQQQVPRLIPVPGKTMNLDTGR